jgi:hypothetical protein
LVCGSIGTVLHPVQTDSRDVEPLSSCSIDEREANDRRHLAQKAKGVNAALLVSIFRPWHLNQPAKLARNPVDKALDPCRSGTRLNRKQVIKPSTLVPVTEPSFADSVCSEQKDYREEQGEEVLLEERAPMTASPNHGRGARMTQLTSLRSARAGISGNSSSASTSRRLIRSPPWLGEDGDRHCKPKSDPQSLHQCQDQYSEYS